MRHRKEYDDKELDARELPEDARRIRCPARRSWVAGILYDFCLSFVSREVRARGEGACGYVSRSMEG